MIKIALFLLAVGVVGVPVNHPLGYALLLAAVFALCVGTLAAPPRRLALAAGIAALTVLAQAVLSPPRIEEGHNVFLADPARPSDALAAGLPAEAYRIMRAEFERAYPPERRCERKTYGCWLHFPLPARAFAFSGDGIYDRPAYSRRVAGVDFARAQDWRPGFVNENIFNWYNDVSDVERARPRRVGRFLRVHWDASFPWFTMLRVPAAYAGGELCWRGTVLWEGPRERFTALTHADKACRRIEAADAEGRIFGLAIARDPPLSMRLDPPWHLRLRQALAQAAMAAGIAAILLLTVRVRLREAALPFGVLAATLAVVGVLEPTMFTGVYVYPGGDDGLVHEGFGRQILQAALQGDFAAALRGVEPVYYFVPGLRYFRALEKLVFGDTNFAYLSLLLAAPLLLIALYRRLMSWPWALLAAALYVSSWGAVFGLDFRTHLEIAAHGYADPAGFIVLLAGLVLLVGVWHPPGEGGAWRGLAGAALLALAVFLRPNLFPPAAIAAAGGFALAAYGRRFALALAIGTGFSAVGVMALHNWVFGGVFVPFGANVAIPEVVVVPPRMLAAALWHVLQFDLQAEAVTKTFAHVKSWLAGPTNKPALAALSLAQVLILLRVASWGGAGHAWVRLIAAAALAGHAVAMIYAHTPRYHFATWPLTAIVATAWLRGEAFPMLRRMAPALSKRWDAHPWRRAVVVRWRRFERHGLPT